MTKLYRDKSWPKNKIEMDGLTIDHSDEHSAAVIRIGRECAVVDVLRLATILAGLVGASVIPSRITINQKP